jgi:hypothetical protein
MTKLGCALLSLVTAPSLLLRNAVAQDTLSTQEYAVKFVCGQALAERPAVAPGRYFTAINIHNPNPESAVFLRKYAFTLPNEVPGPIVRDSLPLKLGSDQALELDCLRILRLARVFIRSPFAKGFAVIQSRLPLDVVAVYTGADSLGALETMHMERVPARSVRTLLSKAP